MQRNNNNELQIASICIASTSTYMNAVHGYKTQVQTGKSYTSK